MHLGHLPADEFSLLPFFPPAPSSTPSYGAWRWGTNCPDETYDLTIVYRDNRQPRALLCDVEEFDITVKLQAFGTCKKIKKNPQVGSQCYKNIWK